LERRDDELLHLEHALEGSRPLHELFHVVWHDLPAHAEAIDEPAALLGLGHRREAVPEQIDLILPVTLHLERNAAAEAVVDARAIVVADEPLLTETKLTERQRCRASLPRRGAVRKPRADAGATVGTHDRLEERG